MYRHLQGDCLYRTNPCSWIRTEIEFVQHHNGSGAAVPRRSQITFHSARAEVVVQSGYQEDIVDIGSQDLFALCSPGGAAREPAPARQDGANLSNAFSERR